MLLGGDAGLRRDELRGLRWPNVNLDREVMYICDNFIDSDPLRLPKGGGARWVPSTETLMDALKSLERLQRYDEAKELAEEYTERAFAALKPLGDKKQALESLGKALLSRTR